MWEYQHAFIKTESLEVAFANWINRDGWEYVDRVLWRVEPNGLPTWSILFRRPLPTGAIKRNPMKAESEPTFSEMRQAWIDMGVKGL